MYNDKKTANVFILKKNDNIQKKTHLRTKATMVDFMLMFFSSYIKKDTEGGKNNKVTHNCSYKKSYIPPLSFKVGTEELSKYRKLKSGIF